jgi:NADPH-dependent curcumin reductase CurA
MKNLQVRIRRLPNGSLAPEDLELVEADAPAPGRGEMLARTLHIALDAHALEPRLLGSSWETPQAGDVVRARAVCEIVDSRNEIFNRGDIVLLDAGVQQYYVSPAQGVHRVKTGGAPASAALGILGAPGLLAYCGLIDLAQISPGKTVVVAAAACISGAMAGHVARIKLCRTIGVARSPEETAWCLRDGHFSACIDMQTQMLDARLHELAPRGVDVCFDGEGGALAAVVLKSHLAPGGHVLIANATEQRKYPPNASAQLWPLDETRCEHRREAFLRDAIPWYAEGHLRYREDAVAGLGNAPAHLCKVVRGQTFGQALVRNPAS